MHEVLVNRLGGLSLPRKSVVRLTDHPDMTLDVYSGRKTTIQQQQLKRKNLLLVKQMPSVLKVIKRSRNETGRESLLFLSLFSNGPK